MPIAAMSFGVRPASANASAATPAWVAQISLGLCSTQQGWGKICGNSFCATDLMEPAWSKTIARELVVPWSRAKMYFMGELVALFRRFSRLGGRLFVIGRVKVEINSAK